MLESSGFNCRRGSRAFAAPAMKLVSIDKLSAYYPMEPSLSRAVLQATKLYQEIRMPILLWLLGVPLSLIIILWLVGVF